MISFKSRGFYYLGYIKIITINMYYSALRFGYAEALVAIQKDQ